MKAEEGRHGLRDSGAKRHGGILRKVALPMAFVSGEGCTCKATVPVPRAREGTPVYPIRKYAVAYSGGDLPGQ